MKARSLPESAARSSEKTTIPPLAAIAAASVRVSSALRSVSRRRAIRQSGSFNHRRRCIQVRESTLRTALRVDGTVSSIPGIA